eukprot:TRINITY_DN46574_c0_g1_i1.p1 TRINITY_DN46574_c0_g1~~TRINITY_DN46574_c0_g1_i1.p1  ORF type:complete len:282 (-),score=-38.78 TRINITY_DN46574_c0_g1_i1:613-1458(-)
MVYMGNGMGQVHTTRCNITSIATRLQLAPGAVPLMLLETPNCTSGGKIHKSSNHPLTAGCKLLLLDTKRCDRPATQQVLRSFRQGKISSFLNSQNGTRNSGPVPIVVPEPGQPRSGRLPLYEHISCMMQVKQYCHAPLGKEKKVTVEATRRKNPSTPCTRRSSCCCLEKSRVATSRKVLKCHSFLDSLFLLCFLVGISSAVFPLAPFLQWSRHTRLFGNGADLDKSPLCPNAAPEYSIRKPRLFPCSPFCKVRSGHPFASRHREALLDGWLVAGCRVTYCY